MSTLRWARLGGMAAARRALALAALAGLGCGHPNDAEPPRPCDPGTRRACDLDGKSGGDLCTDARAWSGVCEVEPEADCDPGICETTGLCRRREALVVETYGPGQPCLCWSGARFGVGWSSGETMDASHYFATLTPEGYLASEPQRTVHLYTPQYSHCAWSGEVFGVTVDIWEAFPFRSWLAVVEPGGDVVSSDWLGGYPPEMPTPSLIRAADDGLWASGGRAFTKLDGVGLDAGESFSLSFSTDGRGSSPTAVGWASSKDEILVVWGVHGVSGDVYEYVFATRYARNGDRVGADVQLEDVTSSRPSIVWTGENYAVAWGRRATATEGDQLRFSRLGGDGTLLEPVLVLTTADDAAWSGPSLVWTGAGYVVFWRDQLDGVAVMRALRLDADGSPRPESLVLSQPGRGFAMHPQAVWTGDAVAVAWEQDVGIEATDYKTRLTRLTLCE